MVAGFGACTVGARPLVKQMQQSAEVLGRCRCRSLLSSIEAAQRRCFAQQAAGCF
jgi:hypothetical protein